MTYRLEGILHSGRSPCPPSWPAGSPCSLPPESPPPCWSHVSDRELNFLFKFHNFSTCNPSFPLPTALASTATQPQRAATTRILITIDNFKEDGGGNAPACVRAVSRSTSHWWGHSRRSVVRAEGQHRAPRKGVVGPTASTLIVHTS